jgi:Arc/MetJ-type ribon-helix-helix transcriptional regulator
MSVHCTKTVQTNIAMPESMHKFLKIACAEDGISISECVRTAINEWIKERSERLDAEAAEQAEKDLQTYGTISIAEMDKAMGL